MELNRTYKNVEKSNGTIRKNRDEKSCNLHIKARRKLGYRDHRIDRSAGKEKQGSTNENNDKKHKENKIGKVAKYDRDYW
jgi:hypothetical protein